MLYFGFDRPSFALRRIGAGRRPPKLVANFTTGTYKAGGATKTFADLFTFTRAGKAWLVKESGLQEYAADVPRFDDGLLIEQEATNLCTDSLLQNGDGDFNSKGGNYTVTSDTILQGGMISFIADATQPYLYRGAQVSDGSEAYLSVYVSKSNLSDDMLFSRDSEVGDARLIGSYDPVLMESTNVDGLKKASFSLITSGSSFDAGRRGINRYSTQNSREGDMRMHTIQEEKGVVASSLIVTTDSPVTRPADFLSTKVSGTTITGDWDSTLTLSISNGQIVHSGYGRIRTLEIN